MQREALALRAQGKRIAFVPTMGYLHEGHAALLRDARTRGDVLVLSIFVNPTQFGPNEDFDRYPRDVPRDLAIATNEKTDLVFLPTKESMYPPGSSTFVEVTGVAEPLEGEKRPGHFRGVATVVAKLFGIVQPHVAVFGQKDWQQLAVLRRMTKDLNLAVEIVGHPIVREPDGLALSSRNVYLSPEERTRALALSRSLAEIDEAWRGGERDPQALEAIGRRVIRHEPDAAVPVSIDYVAVADPDSMRPAQRGASRMLVALAVRVGKTRLIDNRLLQ
ncbi:MAG TPA: pantoate--beta-alanine ligase [bacterium]|nr:pantoate--beta-alanine ligase [bacterium]